MPDPVALAPRLADALEGVVDPRKRRGVRHGLVAVLTVAVCAVAAGARSFVAVAEWVADLPDEVAATLGVDRRCPSESTIRGEDHLGQIVDMVHERGEHGDVGSTTWRGARVGGSFSAWSPPEPAVRVSP